MINLIPDSAKRKLRTEYWIRAVSVWGMLWGCALFLGAVALLPTYVLLSQQVSVYAASAASASEKVAEYEDVTDQLRAANVQSQNITAILALPTLSTYIDNIEKLATNGITLDQVTIRRGEEQGLAPVLVSGMATDRQALQSFRDSLLAESWIAEVDLPISNLAQGQDIMFSITVTPDTETNL